MPSQPTNPLARALMQTPAFQAAQSQMRLTPQEQNLYAMHLNNLYGPGGVDNPNGSRSTLFQMVTTGPDGRFYNVPTVWNGRIMEPNAAYDMAAKYGMENFPSYSTPEEADARYEQMHGFMERDTGDFLAQRKASK